ncbi:helix-turn-helix domain-containing protein [Maridesulfovibrio zosterae]|uniref:helix-turn-helix domain-containing protein n=1 Tax=Maridesulfovibrio zosterae TaxID=82171 RepID=UPI001B7FB274|nr:response regulator transcription factor [Maridesulfovibrio zosterae]
MSIMSRFPDEFNGSTRPQSGPISSDFYVIQIMRLLAGDVGYGRTKYDFSHGSMKFVAPGQILEWDRIITAPWGYSLVFHKDYIRGHVVEKQIKQCNFFSYDINEALHLSQKEELSALGVFRTIYSEYQADHDVYSSDIILAQIETLLRFSTRYYERQFDDRKKLNTEFSLQFEALLTTYFESGKPKLQGMPSVEWAAEELSLSPRYLSDTLKAETGKTALEHIHNYLIDTAKSLLLIPDMTVSEAAYQLGFEYPQYFSRLFKNKTGLSPSEYRIKKTEY